MYTQHRDQLLVVILQALCLELGNVELPQNYCVTRKHGKDDQHEAQHETWADVESQFWTCLLPMRCCKACNSDEFLLQAGRCLRRGGLPCQHGMHSLGICARYLVI